MSDIKNPYKRSDHQAAFEAALKHLRNGLNRFQVSQLLDKAIPRNTRQNIAAKAARLFKREQ